MRTRTLPLLAVTLMVAAAFAGLIADPDGSAAAPLPEGVTHNISIGTPGAISVQYGDYLVFSSVTGYSDIQCTSGLQLVSDWSISNPTGGYKYYWKFRAVAAGSDGISFTSYGSGLQIFGHWIIQPSVTTKAFTVTISKVPVTVNTSALQNISVKVGDSWTWALVPSVQPPGGWKCEILYGSNSLAISNEASRSVLSVVGIVNSQTKYRISPVDPNYGGTFDFVLTPSNPTTTVEFLEPPSYATAGEQWTYNVSTDPPGATISYEVTGGNASNVNLTVLSDGGNTGKLTGVFAAPGQYTIKVTATATGYDPSFKSFDVHVTAPVTVTGEIITGTITAYERSGYPGLYDFMATGFGNYTSIEWDFGDGSSNDYNITQTEHQFVGSGTWNVSVTFSNSETSVTVDVPVLRIDSTPLPEVQYGTLYSYTAAVPSTGVITATLPSWLTMGTPFTAAGGHRYVTISGYADLPMEDMINETYDCTIKAGTVTWEAWSVTVRAADSLVPVSRFDATRDGLTVTVTSQALYAQTVSYSVYDALGKFLFSVTGDVSGDAVLVMPADGTYTIKQTATRYGATTVTAWSAISVNVLGSKSDAAEEGRAEVVDPLPPPPYADATMAVLIALILGALAYLGIRSGHLRTGAASALILIAIIAGTYLLISGEISWVPWMEWRH